MKAGPDRLGYELTGVRAVRAVWTTAAFVMSVAVLPELEDVGSIAFIVGGLSGLAFVVCALAGGAWAFDAGDLEAARARASKCWEAASLSGLIFGAALLSQVSLAPEGWSRWAFFLAPFAGWLGWLEYPWARLEHARSLVQGEAPTVASYDAKIRPGLKTEESAAARTLPPGVEALLVGAGTFRVDRARMLDVLAKYQTGDPEAFLLPWLRLAVASGAEAIELSTRESGIELHFGGKPLSVRYCADPFEALVGEEDATGEAERHRHLAWGLVNLLPLAPRAVLGISGSARLLVEPKGVEKKNWVDPEPRLGTALRVVFDGWDADLRAARCVERARAAWGVTDAVLKVDGVSVPAWEPRPGVGTRFSLPTARGIFYKEDSPAEFYPPRLYWLGVAVCSDPRITLPQGWACRMTFEGLETSASLFTVLWNDAYRSVERPVRREFDRLAEEGRLTGAVLRAPAYTKAGLASALAGVALSFAAFAAAESARPDLAWAAAGAYALTTTAVLVLLGRWALARLRGRTNPFKAG